MQEFFSRDLALPLLPNHTVRIERARRSINGLSVGDAFGDRFFATPESIERRLELRDPPPGRWPVTDDTIMAISVVEVLAEKGEIDRDLLATKFAKRYQQDPGRGYGGTAHGILRRLGDGEHWSIVAPSVFSGGGSMGNGGAMRAGPVGAYFADDENALVEQARRSAEVTHAHLEGQAGAIAVALAAAYVARGGTHPDEMFDAVLARTPPSETRESIGRAKQLSLTYDVRTAVSALGNGTQVIAQDTVPFCLWCAARHLDDYEAAMWTTVSGLGDRDTTCAIVGSIVTASTRLKVPASWLTARESLGDFTTS